MDLIQFKLLSFFGVKLINVSNISTQKLKDKAKKLLEQAKERT